MKAGEMFKQLGLIKVNEAEVHEKLKTKIVKTRNEKKTKEQTAAQEENEARQEKEILEEGDKRNIKVEEEIADDWEQLSDDDIKETKSEKMIIEEISVIDTSKQDEESKESRKAQKERTRKEKEELKRV